MSYFKKPLSADDSSITDTIGTVTDAVRPISSVAMAYHGYKRTKSAGWALAWAAFGAVAPLIAPAIAYAEGFAKPKSGG